MADLDELAAEVDDLESSSEDRLERLAKVQEGLRRALDETDRESAAARR